MRCVLSSACFAECSRWSRASQLGPHKIPYVAPANSKEHEVEVTALRRGGRVGRACGTAGPRTSPSDARENFPSESRTNTNLIHRARPGGRPVESACGFLSRTDAGQVPLEPTANGSRRETSLNHRHFVAAHRYRMPLRSQGGFRGGGGPQDQLDDRLVPACPSCSRVEEPNNIALGHASHCCTAR